MVLPAAIAAILVGITGSLTLHPAFASSDVTPQAAPQGQGTPILIAPFASGPPPTGSSCVFETTIDHVTLSTADQRFVVGGHMAGLEWRQCGGGTSELSLWDLATGESIQTLLTGYTTNDTPTVQTLDGDPGVEVGKWATEVIFIPQRAVVAAAIADSTVRFWDSETGLPLGQWQDHEKAVWAIAASADGQVIATGSADHTVRIKRLASDSLAVLRRTVLELPQAVRHLQLSDDGQTLVAISGNSLQDTIVHLWRLESGQWQRVNWEQRYPLREVDFSYTHQNVARLVHLTDDGRLITGHEDGVIRLWDGETGVRMLSLQHHQEAIVALAISPSGRWLASSASDGTKLWNLATGQLIRTLDTIGQVQFTGENILWVSRQRLARTERWNWRSAGILGMIPFGQVTLSANGQIVAGYDSREVGIWR